MIIAFTALVSAQTFAPVNTNFTFAGSMYISAPNLRVLNCPISGSGTVNGAGKVKITSVTACVAATNLPWAWAATGPALAKGKVSFSANGTDCTTNDQLYVSGGVFTFTDNGRSICTINGDVLTTPTVRIVP